MNATERTEADYHVRLTDFVRRWESKYPAEAAELRLVVMTRMGMKVPPEGRIAQTALDMEFREAVRAQLGKPTLREYLRGNDG